MAKKSTKKPAKTKRSSKKKPCKGIENVGGIKSITFVDQTDLSNVVSGVVTAWNPKGKHFYRYEISLPSQRAPSSDKPSSSEP